MTTRDYQQNLKNGIYEAWQRGARNVLGVLPTGGGKTWIFSEIVKEHSAPAVAIAHRQEIVSQISLSFAKHGVRHRIIAPNNVVKLINRLHMEEVGRSFYHPSAPVAVAGVDTLIRRNNLNGWCDSVTMWVQDECFSAGTLIDGTPIENLRAGDFVTSFDEKTGRFEKKKVLHLFKNPLPRYMVRVKIGHHVINTTGNHPFYTKRGWVEAKNLTKNDEVLYYELHALRSPDFESERIPNLSFKKIWKNILLQKVRNGLSYCKFKTKKIARTAGAVLLRLWKKAFKNDSKVNYSTICTGRSRVLWKRVFWKISPENFFRNNGEDKPKICIGSNEKEQPYAQRKFTRENGEYVKRNRASSENSGWKRHGANRGRGFTFSNIRAIGVCSTTSYPNGWWKRLPPLLQTGPWPLGFKTGNRSGWRKSLFPEKAFSRPEKRDMSKWIRVDSATIFKSGDFERNGKSDAENYVYNIEVEDFHTYLVDGVVVHNCHHVLQGNKWGTAAALFRNAKGLGVTATPLRADGKGLGRHADGVFDEMVIGPEMRELINRGFLSEYRVFAPPSDIDLSQVKIGANGDYTLPGVKNAVRKSRVIGDVVKHYKLIAPGKLGITFASDVETARDIAAQFNANGVPAEVVHAGTKDFERVSILNRFRRRELLQLVNVDLFGEGFDLPAVEVVSMARPTKSYGLYAQQFGRALRIMDGKDRAIIIDHVGNIVCHGLPDRPRQWSLDRRERRTRDADPDVIPVRVCPQCTAVFERIYKTCPYCNVTPKPMARSGPEFVDGDLTELDAETLARMRGEVVDLAMTPQAYLSVSGAGRLPHVAAMSAAKQFRLKQEAQNDLRASIALWAGYQRALNRPDSESYRRFYFRYGLDVLSAMALGRREAEELKLRIDNDVNML